MAACKVDSTASPQFVALREQWRRGGYPSIVKDLDNAFTEIAKDVQACHCRKVPRFADILGSFDLHKYRYKDSAAREGARGGWRVYALYDKVAGVLYPIIPYPHKEWVDADDKYITDCVKEILKLLAAAIEAAKKTDP